ncbi:uncharacterized protein [Argopecten irradians]|uniref:uncharacterized protein n=1 Tax=Argopecten irradians TaxID=31199 RepID=UPI0037213004
MELRDIASFWFPETCLFPEAETREIVCAAGPQCFECSSVSRLESCGHSTTCKEGQKCYVQKTRTHDGLNQYTSGCINNQSCFLNTNYGGDSQVTVPYGQIACFKCCSGDHCNSRGCGDTGPPSWQSRGPYCYKCNQLQDPDDCRSLTICARNEVCTINETISGGYVFTSGCLPKSECLHEGPLVGRSVHSRGRSVQLCQKCCSNDFCNQHCQDQHQSDLSWSAWGAWSKCSTSCGSHGNQVRSRTCRNTQGQGLSGGCDGTSRDERQCSGGACSGCDTLYTNGEHTSGIYTIAPTGYRPFNVFCDMTDGGSWTVIQHRLDGDVSFNRNWTDYVTGFGNLRNDFWLGLEYIHEVTKRGVEAVIDMITAQGEPIRYSYGHFSVKNASTFYELSVSNDTSVNCSSQYRLLYNDGAKFTTPDRYDHYGCAIHGSGWWFNGCSYFNPNGKFGLADVNYGMAVYCHSKDIVLKEISMKIR